MSTEARVTYDVRDILDEIRDDVKALRKDVADLQQKEASRSAITAVGGKVWVVGVAMLGIIVNIPAMNYYLNGGR